jgi:hypothetical protein
MLSDERRHFRKCPNNNVDRMGIFPTRFSANKKQEDPLAYYPAGLHIL